MFFRCEKTSQIGKNTLKRKRVFSEAVACLFVYVCMCVCVCVCVCVLACVRTLGLQLQCPIQYCLVPTIFQCHRYGRLCPSQKLVPPNLSDSKFVQSLKTETLLITRLMTRV